MKTRFAFFILLTALLVSCRSDEQTITGTWKMTKYSTGGNYYDVVNDPWNIETGAGYYLEVSEDNTWTSYMTQYGQTHISNQGTWKFAADNTILQLVAVNCNSDHTILAFDNNRLEIRVKQGQGQYSCTNFSALEPGAEMYFEKQ